MGHGVVVKCCLFCQHVGRPLWCWTNYTKTGRLHLVKGGNKPFTTRWRSIPSFLPPAGNLKIYFISRCCKQRDPAIHHTFNISAHLLWSRRAFITQRYLSRGHDEKWWLAQLTERRERRASTPDCTVASHRQWPCRPKMTLWDMRADDTLGWTDRSV